MAVPNILARFYRSNILGYAKAGRAVNISDAALGLMDFHSREKERKKSCVLEIVGTVTYVGPTSKQISALDSPHQARHA